MKDDRLKLLRIAINLYLGSRTLSVAACVTVFKGV